MAARAGLLLQMASKDWPAAAALVESLLADAPDFSPALSGLVQYRNSAHIAHPGQFRDIAKHLETLRIAQRAVQLDPLDSRAQLSLAWTYQLLGPRGQIDPACRARGRSQRERSLDLDSIGPDLCVLRRV